MLTNRNNDLLQDHQNRWISLERKRLDQRIETGRTRIAGCHSRWSHIPPLSHPCVCLVSSRLAFPRLLFLDNQLHSTCLPEDTPVSTGGALAILGKDISEGSLLRAKMLLLLLLPLIVTASEGPLPHHFEEASWQKVGLWWDFILTQICRLLTTILQLQPHHCWPPSLASQKRKRFLRIE